MTRGFAAVLAPGLQVPKQRLTTSRTSTSSSEVFSQPKNSTGCSVLSKPPAMLLPALPTKVFSLPSPSLSTLSSSSSRKTSRSDSTPKRGSAHCRSTFSTSPGSTVIPKVGSSPPSSGSKSRQFFERPPGFRVRAGRRRVAVGGRFPGGDVVAFGVDEVVVAGGGEVGDAGAGHFFDRGADRPVLEERLFEVGDVVDEDFGFGAARLRRARRAVLMFSANANSFG